MIALAIQVLGIATVAVGVGMWFVPAGIIVAGVGITLFGLAFERSR